MEGVAAGGADVARREWLEESKSVGCSGWAVVVVACMHCASLNDDGRFA